jgi:hypothetical protein
VHLSAACTAEQLLISICNFSLCKKKEKKDQSMQPTFPQHLGVHTCETNSIKNSWKEKA